METFDFLPYKKRTFWPVVSPDAVRSMGWYQELKGELQAYKEGTPGRAIVQTDPIRHILAVGALCCDEGIEHGDYLMLRNAVKLCTQNGFSIRNDFDLSVMNLDKSGQGDFLQAEGKADLVVTCFIFDGKGSNGAFSRYFSMKLSHGPEDPKYFQSGLHNKDGVWHEAAKRFGARIVMTFGRSDSEVTPGTFAPARGQENLYECCTGEEGFIVSRGMGILLRADVKREALIALRKQESCTPA